MATNRFFKDIYMVYITCYDVCKTLDKVTCQARFFVNNLKKQDFNVCSVGLHNLDFVLYYIILRQMTIIEVKRSLFCFFINDNVFSFPQRMTIAFLMQIRLSLINIL